MSSYHEPSPFFHRLVVWGSIDSAETRAGAVLNCLLSVRAMLRSMRRRAERRDVDMTGCELHCGQDTTGM